MAQEVDLPTESSEMNLIAAVLQAIGHPTRLKILCFLGDEEKIVSDVLNHVGSTQSNISQHIQVLRRAGVLQSRREHNKVYCSIQTEEVLPLINQIKNIFCEKQTESGLIFI